MRSSALVSSPRPTRGTDVAARFAGAAALLAALTLTSTVGAEEFPPCDKTPSADDVEAAKGMHKAAEQYYAKARYERAIESWRDAYGFDCTAHRLLINVGNAYEKLGRTAKAVEAFELYVARMGDAADSNIIEKVANLRAQLDSSGPPDPDPVVPNPTPTPVPTPVPDPDVADDESVGPGPWIVLGTGVAVAIVGGVLLGVGTSQEEDALADCPNRKCSDQAQIDLGNEGITMQIAGGTMLAVGLVAVAGGLTWYLIGSDAFGTAHLPVQINVGVTPELGAVTLSGSF